MHIEAGRAPDICLTNQTLKGYYLLISKVTVNDGKNVNVAAAGAEPTGRQGPVQDHRPDRRADGAGKGVGEQLRSGQGGQFFDADHTTVLPELFRIPPA